MWKKKNIKLVNDQQFNLTVNYRICGRTSQCNIESASRNLNLSLQLVELSHSTSLDSVANFGNISLQGKEISVTLCRTNAAVVSLSVVYLAALRSSTVS